MAENIRDKAWITAHVRMITEARVRHESWFLNFLIFWYSTVLTCLMVYQLTAPSNEMRDVISAAIAIVVFALSILVPSFGLTQRADRFRECYLKIQRLLATVTDDEDFVIAYHDVLEAYPNHPHSDYITLVVRSKLNNEKLEVGMNQKLPSCSMNIQYYVRVFFRVVLFSGGVLSPGFLFFIL